MSVADPKNQLISSFFFFLFFFFGGGALGSILFLNVKKKIKKEKEKKKLCISQILPGRGEGRALRLFIDLPLKTNSVL